VKTSRVVLSSMTTVRKRYLLQLLSELLNHSQLLVDNLGVLCGCNGAIVRDGGSQEGVGIFEAFCF
jgi:hypothetical protein